MVPALALPSSGNMGISQQLSCEAPRYRKDLDNYYEVKTVPLKKNFFNYFFTAQAHR
jgi:hypothetical protein